jgi:hypothetical protein
MNKFRTIAAALALVAGSLAIAVSPASAAEPNNDGTNCHGVYLSYLATSDTAPGQLHHDYDASVKDVQAFADSLCQS